MTNTVTPARPWEGCLRTALEYHGRSVLAARHALVRATTLAPARTYPVRWETTARRCAMPSCPREALAFHTCCALCAPEEVRG